MHRVRGGEEQAWTWMVGDSSRRPHNIVQKDVKATSRRNHTGEATQRVGGNVRTCYRGTDRTKEIPRAEGTGRRFPRPWSGRELSESERNPDLSALRINGVGRDRAKRVWEEGGGIRKGKGKNKNKKSDGNPRVGRERPGPIRNRKELTGHTSYQRERETR